MAADKDPTRLVRDRAGAYHSADERFSVRNEGGTWYAEDTVQLDELGLPHLLGPFPSLTDAKEAMADARSEKLIPAKPRKPVRRAAARKPKPEPRPEWTDALPEGERTIARRMAAALGALGIEDAQPLVRADLLGLVPRVATELIRHRVAREAIDAWDDDAVRALASELGADDITALARGVAERTVAHVYAVLDDGAASGRDGHDLPGWELIDTPRARRIRLADGS